MAVIHKELIMNNENPFIILAEAMVKLDEVEVHGTKNMAYMVEVMQKLHTLKKMMQGDFENPQALSSEEEIQNGR